MDKRGIQGGDQWRTQDEDEGITRTIDVTLVNFPSVGAVTVPTMAVATCPDGTGLDAECGPGGVDVTATTTSGVMVVAGQFITMLRLGGAGVELQKGTNYAVAVRYVKDTNNLENRFYIECPDEEA